MKLITQMFGGMTISEPLNPEVAIILVSCPQWPADFHIETVKEPKRSALDISLLDEWTPADLIAYFARVHDKQSSALLGTGEDTLLDDSRPKRRRVFDALWLKKVLDAGEKLPIDGGELPFPEYELWSG